MKVIYECEYCRMQSTIRQEVEACEARGLVPFGGEIKPGDVVFMPGNGYGWWSDDREWFLESRGDPASTCHLERARLGYPLWVVLELVPDTVVNTRPAHREVAILYSPRHANMRSGFACGWTNVAHRPIVRHRSVSADELEQYRAEAREKLPHYPRVSLV